MEMSPEDIALLAESAAPPPEPNKKKKRRARAYNFRKPRLLSQDQLRLLNHVHTGLARDLSVYLSTQLRSIVEMSLVTVEQVHYSEYVETTQTPSSLFVMESDGQQQRMVLEYDPRFVLYTVEKLFGGQGSFQREPREISPIEQRVMKRIVERTYRGLEAVWDPIYPMRLSTVSFETDAQFVQVIPGTEPAVVATFEIGVQEHRAVLRICYPYVIVERMLGRTGITQMLANPSEPLDPEVRRQFKDSLRGTEVQITAELGRTHLSIQEILDLAEGDVIVVNGRTSEPIQVVIGNVPQFKAVIGHSGSRKALRITEVVPQLPEQDKEHDQSNV